MILKTLDIENGVTGRYIRIYARLGTVLASNGKLCSSISLYEFEVYEYSAIPGMSIILEEVLSKQPIASEDYTQLILPETNCENRKRYLIRRNYIGRYLI